MLHARIAARESDQNRRNSKHIHFSSSTLKQTEMRTAERHHLISRGTPNSCADAACLIGLWIRATD